MESTNKGSRLESFVRQIEEMLLPRGFSVKGNSRVYNDEGVQVAEFDVEITGRLGSTDISWLIECRDRPGKGPAPGSWIEQLVGRRDRFGFNKVTAVSATGFAPGAEKYAKETGIELRTVEEVTAEQVARWLGIQCITSVTQLCRLNSVRLVVSQREDRELLKVFLEKVRSANRDDPILRSIETGESVSSPIAFLMVVSDQPALFEDLVPNGPGKEVEIQAAYPSDSSHFVVDTQNGPVRVLEILFKGELFIIQKEFPLESVSDYRRLGSPTSIAQIATFPIELGGASCAVELRNLAEGETHIVLKKFPLE